MSSAEFSGGVVFLASRVGHGAVGTANPVDNRDRAYRWSKPTRRRSPCSLSLESQRRRPRLPPLLHAHQHRHRLASHSTWPQVGNPRRTRGDARLSVRHEHLRHHRRRGGPGWLNVLVILFFWNAAKFAWLATLSPFFLLAHRLWSARDESSAHRHQSEPGSSSTPCSPRPAVSTPAARSRTPSPSWCSAQPSSPPCAERSAEYTSALADPAQSCELCAEGREFGPGGR